MTDIILHPSPGLRKVMLKTWPRGSETHQGVSCEHSLENRDALAHTGLPAHVQGLAAPPSAPELCLPQKDEQTPRATPAACLLLIDDSATVREIVSTMLRQAGYQVHAFSDGIQAMRWLTTSACCPPDLLLVDLGLPKMDGYEVIRRIKAKAPYTHVPCLILSRRDGKIDRLKARLAGATTYLCKPFTVQTLLQAVQTALISKKEGAGRSVFVQKDPSPLPGISRITV